MQYYITLLLLASKSKLVNNNIITWEISVIQAALSCLVGATR